MIVGSAHGPPASAGSAKPIPARHEITGETKWEITGERR